MCSTGVSVWFACKLCKSFFLNGDDFAYHKKKSHFQEFQNTKFIVFEEQTTPPSSLPENWVSFLSPKEETRIHKIISSPLPSLSTTTNADCNSNNESIESNRNEECIEIDPERSNDVNDHQNATDDAGEVPNNCVKLNSNFNSNDNAILDDQDHGKMQSNVASTSTYFALTDEKRDKLCSSRVKATFKRKINSLRRSTRKTQNLPANNEALLQSVIQSRNNPYVYLKRLNLITIQNAPSPSNSAIPIPSQENDKSDTNHNNSDAKSAKQPKVKCENPENTIQNSCTFTSSPMAAVKNCKFCYEHFNSTAELDAHEDICPSKRQFENIICVPPRVTFGSSDEFYAHKQSLHSTSISTPPPEAANDRQPQPADELIVGLKVAFRNEIQLDFPPAICNKSSVNEFSLSVHPGDHVCNTHFNRDFELGAVLNDDNNDNFISDPTTQVVDLNFSSAFELIKTEYVTPGIEDREVPDEDRDPFESVSQVESSAELSLNEAASSSSNSEINQTDTTRYCISCQKSFISFGELKAHYRSYHVTQFGDRKFECPHPNCGTSTRDQYLLKIHLMEVHSNTRAYNCPHPNCTLSFKTARSRGIHLRRVHWKISSCQVSNRFKATNEGVSLSNHSDTNLAPQTDFLRYCIPCKKSFTSVREIRNHNQTYHMTQEGRIRFSCPYSSCEVTTKSQSTLKSHLIQVHSNVRPFKCPHPTCKMSYKTTSSRNRHAKCHTDTKGAPHRTHTDIVEPLAVAVIDLCT